ncbi:MAG: peptidylprolyl isomerase [Proteobacteria bacterium]|nr:peptidylprolyl isomerase [Pseudomonadota bacterium]
MSIQNTKKRFARHLRYGLYVLIAVFVVGLPFMFSQGSFGPAKGQEEAVTGATADVIAQVNGEPLLRARLDAQFNQMMGQVVPIYNMIGQSIGVERLWRFRLDALDQAIVQHLLVRQAEEQNVEISDRELEAHAEELARQEMEGLKARYADQDVETMLGVIVTQTEGRTRERASEKWFVQWLTERLIDESGTAIAEEMMVEAVRHRVSDSVTATEQDLLASFDEASVREIWVRRQARREEDTRTEEEARQRAEELVERLRAGADFGELAVEESEEENAADAGELREEMRRGRMSAEWDEAVFALQPGEVSDPINMLGDYVIVKLESRTRELPDDYESNKQELLANLVSQKQDQVWRDHQTERRESAEVTVVDAEFLAYEALREGDREASLPLLQQASTRAAELGSAAEASIFYQIAVTEASRNEWEAAADAYAASADALMREDSQFPGARAQALLGMARSYEHIGDLEECVLWYQAASDATEIPSIHEQLSSTYERLGQVELAAQEQQWMDDFETAQRARDQASAAQQRAMEERSGAATPRPTPGP